MNNPIQNQKTHPRLARGFTLIELLIVLFIIGILASLSIPHLVHAHNKGKATKIVEDLRVIRDSMTSYHLDKGTWPRSRTWGLLPRGTQAVLPVGISFNLDSWETRYAFTNYSNKSQSWKDQRGYSVILRARIQNVALANVVATLAPNMFDQIRINRKRGIFIIVLD
jgi:type II secretion system protein G